MLIFFYECVLDKLGYAWSHPVETFNKTWSGKVAIFNTVMFGSLEATDIAMTALGENRLLDFAWESVVFLGAVANASYVLVKDTELPTQQELPTQTH